MSCRHKHPTLGGILKTIAAAMLAMTATSSHSASAASKREASMKRLVHEASGGRAVYGQSLSGALKALHRLPGDGTLAQGRIAGGWTPVWVRGAQGEGGSIAYASPDGRYLMVGAIFDRHGVNVTHRLAQVAGALYGLKTASVQSAGPAPSPAPATTGPKTGALAPATTLTAKQFFDESRTVTHGVLQYGGHRDRHTLYVYFDPDCSFCHHLYTRLAALAPQMSKAGVDVDWIPVAILRSGGRGRAEAILKGGARALDYNESHFDMAVERGGILGATSTSADAALGLNMGVFARGGRHLGTPTLTWESQSGKAYRVVGLVTKKGIATILGQISGR